MTDWDYKWTKDPIGTLPPTGSFLSVTGNAVVTSVQRQAEGKLLVRLFNPTTHSEKVSITPPSPAPAAHAQTLEGLDDSQLSVKLSDKSADFTLGAKKFTTIVLG